MQTITRHLFSATCLLMAHVCPAIGASLATEASDDGIGDNGKTYTDAEASVTWAFNSTTSYKEATANPADAFSTINVNTGDLEIVGTGNNKLHPEIAFVNLKPSGTTKSIEWLVKPKSGLKFTPTKVSAYIVRNGTDVENGVVVKARIMGDDTEMTLGTYTAARNNNTKEEDKYGTNENYTDHFEIDLTPEQQEALTSGAGFILSCTIGVSDTKSGGFSDVHINGLINGTASDVEMFAMTTSTSEAEAGDIDVYPSGDEFEAGTELTVTATSKFGYHFSNWTNANGDIVSENAKFTYTLNSDTKLKANFVKVETYSLDISTTDDIESETSNGAKPYLVSLSPEPTIIDGKNMYESGTEVTLTVKDYASKIMTFTGWEDGTTEAERKLTMTADKSVSANFSAESFVVGWDFYAKGNNGRTADYYSTPDNSATTLTLVNKNDGTTQSWLDKSQLSGGYEGKPAAVNWKAIGTYYYQIKVNTAEFENMSLYSEMLLNYNAYSVQNVEYSIDGTNFSKIADITLKATKTWTAVNNENGGWVDLPEEANNQAALYIRWIPDYSSDMLGTTSENDGTAISNIFLRGNQKVVDDGNAPKLTATVPTDKAEGASASGKIVLTFDEKVKLSDKAKATIGEAELTGKATGKTITFDYMGLDYATDYTFTLSAGSVSDLTDNVLNEALSLSFRTMERPSVTKAAYDAVASNVDELLNAIAAANANGNYRILILPGTYDLGTITLVNISKSGISLIGGGKEASDVLIVNHPETAGIGVTAPIQIASGVENTYMQNLTLQCLLSEALGSDPWARGVDVALQDRGNKTILKNVRLLSYQDTYYSNNNYMRSYIEDCEIHGTVDFLCGGGRVIFNQTTFYLENRSGNVIAAPSTATDEPYGYVMLNCTIDGEPINDGSYALARPWQGSPRCVWINTTMKVLPKAEGYSNMGPLPGLFAEYDSHTEGGTAIDLSYRKKTFDVKQSDNSTIPTAITYDPILSAEEAAEYTISNVLAGSDAWMPQMETESAQLTEVVLNDGRLYWPENPYALCFVIYKDGEYVGQTTECTFDVDGNKAADDAVYTVRAANSRGGLGTAVTAVAGDKPDYTTAIGTSNTDKSVAATEYYTLSGQKTSANAHRDMIIERTIYADGTHTSRKVLFK